MIYMLFFRPIPPRKSPSVIPFEIEPIETTIEADVSENVVDESVETSPVPDLASDKDIAEIEIVETEAEIDQEWDPDSEDSKLLDDLATDPESVGVANKPLASNTEKAGDVESKGEGDLNGEEDAPDAEDQANEPEAEADTESVAEDVAELEDEDAEEAIAEDVDSDSEETTELVVNQDEDAEEAIAKDADTDSEETTELVVNEDEDAEEAIALESESEDANSVVEDDAIAKEDPKSDDDKTLAKEDEEETEPALIEIKPEFTSGVFIVGANGEITIDFLFDGGSYRGELGIFSLNGMDEFEPGSEEFIRELAGRALSNSTSGYVVISDPTEGAKFTGELGEGDSNSGEYLGPKTFTMLAGDQFGFMLVANGRIQQVFDNPDVGGALRPLFSMATANPEDAFHVGQIADVTGNGNTFVMEDLRVDEWTDRDYNDLIFQVRGATGTAVSLDEVIDPAKDWRETDLGKLIVASDTTETEENDPVDIIKILKPDVVDIVDDPTETDIPSVPFTDSEIIKDDWVSSKAYAEGETTPNPNVPPIVDPALVVNPWDVDRSTLFPADYDPLIDGVGSSVTVTQSSNVTTTVNISSSTSVTTIISVPSPSVTPPPTVTPPVSVNNAPIVPSANVTLGLGENLNRYFFTAYDPDAANPNLAYYNGDQIQQFLIQDTNTNANSGYFTLNGVKQTGSFYVPASVIYQSSDNNYLKFVAGSEAGVVDPVVVSAYDGQAWGNPGTITINTTAQPGQIPTVTAYNQTLRPGTVLSPDAIFSASDPNGDTVQRYALYDPDDSITSGYFTLKGEKLTGSANGWYFFAANQLASLRFTAGSQDSVDTFRINAVDGLSWGSRSIQITTNTSTTNIAPVVSTINRTLDIGTTISPNFFAVSDANSDTIQKYYFSDNNSSSTSGYFTLNGVRQQDIFDGVWRNNSFFVDASQLANVKFVAGSQAGTDSVTIQAYDGKSWSSYANVNLTTKVANREPVVTVYPKTLDTGTSTAVSNLFTFSDPDGDTIQTYHFTDFGYFGDGYFTYKGVPFTWKNTTSVNYFEVNASELANVRFVAGSQAGINRINIQVYDGELWSKFTPFNITTQQANRAPLVTTTNKTLDIGGNRLFASDFFTVTDADGDAMQQYYFYDANPSSTSGYFTVNGTKQDSPFYVTPSNLATVRFVAGSQVGTDTVYVQAYDGKAWSNYPSVSLTTLQPNRVPTVTAQNKTLDMGTSIAASNFFTVTDADGDTIQQYRFDDFTSSSTSGYLTFNGVRQNAGFSVTASQLANVRFVAGSQAGTDDIVISAYDGKAWNSLGFGAGVAKLTTKQANRAPIVTTTNRTINTGTITNADFFTVSDPDGDTILDYYFVDNNTSSTSGYFTLNGVKQASSFYALPSQLASIKFVAGSQAGNDSVTVYAGDGKAWSSGTNAILTTQQANRAPLVMPINRTINTGTTINADFFTVTDPDGDVIQQYYFADNNTSATSGHFTLNGVKQTAGFYVAANQLASVKFVAGTQAGSDSVTIYASDGKTWGFNNATITTQQVNRAPIVTTYNQNLNIGTNIAANFFTVSDPDGDVIQQYYFYDQNSSSTSGYFTLNGVRQAAGFSVVASQLASVKFVSGSQVGTDTVTVYASDGKAWGYRDVALNTQQPNRPPVVTTYNQTVKRGNSISPNFSVTDADGDAITQYAFYDSNATSTSGYFTVNGVKQTAGTVFYVNASQLSSIKFVGGSTSGTDGLYIQAFDGKAWSAWSNYTTTTIGGSAPTVTLGSTTVDANTTKALNLSSTDPDGDPVTRYEFFDGNTTATSGYFTVNSVKQAAGTSFFVDASQLNTVKFVGGATGGIDQVAVRGTDGLDGWSAWSYANMTTQAVVTNDWFDLNIKDTTIRSLARSKFQDGIFSRQDMIEIFDSAKDSSVVDANEFADLRLLASDVTYIKMADHVRNLSQKVAMGDTNTGWTNQNAKSLGQSLGNLYSGSSASQLEKLVNEHFFGKDLPSLAGTYAYGSASQSTYQYVQGNLFQGGIQYTDVRQGVLGDCYYLSALAGIAIKDASKIQDMFIDNGDGTYTVRFFNGGKTEYVTVNRQLPTDPYGGLSFAQAGNWTTYSNTNNELWVALAEKAYAQINEAGWIGQDGTNSYKGIEGGWMHLPTTQVTNWAGSLQSLSSLNAVVSAFTSGKAVAFGSKSSVQSPVVTTHAYTLVDYANGQFKLFNPWGINNWTDGGYVYQTWDQLVSNYSAYTVNG